MSNSSSEQYRIEEFVIEEEPFYVAASDEVEIFEAAYRQHVPVLLKGPTGTGKTRFVEYMAWRLGQPLTVVKDGVNGGANGTSAAAVPLVTVACHEDLTASGFDDQREAIEPLELPLERAPGHQFESQALPDLEALKQKSVLDIDRVLGHRSLARTDWPAARRRRTCGMASCCVESSHVMSLSFRNQVSCRLA